MLLKRDNLLSQWQFGVTDHTFSGDLSLIRVETVRTKRGTFRLPMRKLAVLPTN